VSFLCLLKRTFWSHLGILSKLEQIPKIIKQLELNKSRTILVIEDLPIEQQRYTHLFENRNYAVELTSSTENAIDIIKEKDVELLLISAELKETDS